MVLDIYIGKIKNKFMISVYNDFGVEDLIFTTQSAILNYFRHLTSKGYALKLTMVGGN